MSATGLIAAAEAIPTAMLGLLFRIGVFSVFWRAAWPKLQNWDLTIALFQDEYLAALPFLPAAPMAYLAFALEVVCSALVVVGLATRLAALPLLGMTIFIQLFVYWTSWPQHLLWAVLLVYLVARGPGAWSLDHLIARRHAARPA